MKIHSWFDNQTADWAAFGEYTIIKSGGVKYITPAINAKVTDYDPLKASDSIVIDALNIGIMIIGNADKNKIEKYILDFCGKYGLLGFMSALPTTPDFWEDNEVYIPKNPILRSAKMPVKEYVDMFFPQEKTELINKKAKAMQWFLGDLIGDEPLIGVNEKEVMYCKTSLSQCRKRKR